MFDYSYTRNSNPFHTVKLTLDGAYREMGWDNGEEATQEELTAMANMLDVEGWTMCADEC